MAFITKNGDGTVSIKIIHLILTFLSALAIPILLWVFTIGKSWANYTSMTEKNNKKIEQHDEILIKIRESLARIEERTIWLTPEYINKLGKSR